eukprot:gene12916-15171_t
MSTSSTAASVNAAAATQIIVKIKSKEFKDRLTAYDEMLALFSSLPDVMAPEFARLYPAFEKFALVDPQPTNREKALQALLVFIDRAACLQSAAPQSLTDLCTAIIENGLSARDSTKVKAIDCLLMLVEVVGPDNVVQSLCTGAAHKAYKIATYSLFTLKELVRQYGCSAINVDPIVAQLLPGFEHQIKEVRAEALALALELYQWLPEVIAAQLKPLRPAQMRDFESSIATLSSTPPTPQRTIRPTHPNTASPAKPLNPAPTTITRQTSNLPLPPSGQSPITPPPSPSHQNPQ